ncbi:MAG: DUF1415 domain-containing protein [Chitinophagaceae bacterium]|nr:DUF1415 domain-containing protein [Chitinophagaceae bacterium]
MVTEEQVIEQTKQWIHDVVIGCNFCPFAAHVVKQQTVFYRVETSVDLEECLRSFFAEVERLDAEQGIETSFLIFPNAFTLFDDYLSLVAFAEALLKKRGYEGVYQVASFHPKYLFANSTEEDAANYTNRSIYPMLHLLREASIDKALANYKDPESIPEQNINFAGEKGLAYMKTLRSKI